MKTEKGGGGTSIEKGDEGKCEWEGKGRGREPATGKKIDGY